jgi:hypothetical protein
LKFFSFEIFQHVSLQSTRDLFIYRDTSFLQEKLAKVALLRHIILPWTHLNSCSVPFDGCLYTETLGTVHCCIIIHPYSTPFTPPDGDRGCRAGCCGSGGGGVVEVDGDGVEGKRWAARATVVYLNSEKIQRIKYLT